MEISERRHRMVERHVEARGVHDSAVLEAMRTVPREALRRFDDKGSPMSEQREDEEPALHSELVALRKRVEALEARVTELEEELRETQEAATSD